MKAIEEQASEEVKGRLIAHYYEINAGIGVHKSPELYGAFPTDPYSHTPAGKGAQQPGMTGQVKEDILSRMLELGFSVENGKIRISSGLLKKEEFLNEAKEFSWVDVSGNWQSLLIPEGHLVFTFAHCRYRTITSLVDTSTVSCVANRSVGLIG